MKIVSLCVICLFVVACASIKPLEGGQKDEIPPRIVGYYPDSASLNFSGEVVSLEFDEYIKGSNLTQNIIVSPNPKTSPSYTVKGKELEIKFNESLEPNTTYTILLNEAIKDVNEGNTLETAKHLFSTGSFIDSLSLNVVIINSFTKLPCESCMLTVYPAGNDSAVLTSKPIYLNKSSAGGYVNLSNLPNREMRLIAINDEAGNLTLDYDDLISHYRVPNYESTDTIYVFPYIDTRQKKPTLSKIKYPFIYEFTTENTFSEDLRVFVNGDTATFNINSSHDTLVVISAPTQDTTEIIVQLDSISYIYKRVHSDFKPPNRVNIKLMGRNDTSLNFEVSELNPTIDTTKMRFNVDSSTITKYRYTVDQNELHVTSTAFINTSLEVIFNTGAISLSRELSNINDTLNVKAVPSHLPDLNLKLLSSSNNQIIVQLINRKEKVIKEVTATQETNISFLNINPGNYRIRAITDIDKNGQWTTGDLFTKRKPEPITLSTSFELRLDWDKELTLRVN